MGLRASGYRLKGRRDFGGLDVGVFGGGRDVRVVQRLLNRKMGGTNPAQVVSPLEAKLIRVEAGKSRDRSVEGFAR